jgi:DNA-binding CsgD family transcriptional regulator
MESLILKFPHQKEFEITPTPEHIIAGRATVCDICLPNWFSGDVATISSRHFRIYYRPERGFFIEDLHSLNGTFLNDTRLEPDEGEYLRNGDVIRVSNNSRFVITVQNNSERINTVTVATKGLSAMLTMREQEILKLCSSGLRQGDIANHLSISLDAVKTHLRNIRDKFGVETSYQAVQVGRERGLL